jgi:hypothetical protein
MHAAGTLTCTLAGEWAGPKIFTERVALSSTSPTDLPLPRTAARWGFDLLVLPARCKRQSRG